MNEPHIWHYGLVADWWAEFQNEGPEIDYFKQIIERYGQPALDVACGTGRLLRPYLRAGLDVDGCDFSEDMLARCQAKAELEGLRPRLYQQAMHELDLPRRYRTIIVCGSFGLSGDPELDQQALSRFYDHLEPGGALALNLDVVYDAADDWQYWLKENRNKLPEPWPPAGERRRAADGSEWSIQVRLLDLDPINQTNTLQMRVERWVDGEPVAFEERTLIGCFYFKNEMVLKLKLAGFADISILGDYRDEPANIDHEQFIFIARK